MATGDKDVAALTPNRRLASPIVGRLRRRGTAAGYNQFGQDLVDELLTVPNAATRTYTHLSYGQVSEHLGPQYGARWGPDGEFLGFL